MCMEGQGGYVVRVRWVWCKAQVLDGAPLLTYKPQYGLRKSVLLCKPVLLRSPLSSSLNGGNPMFADIGDKTLPN